MFGTLGFTEILMIGGVIAVLFGAKNIPKMGRYIGSGIREFKAGVKDVGTALQEPVDEVKETLREVKRDLVDVEREARK